MNAIKLKICGVQSVDEARRLREAKVDLIGLNFVPSSARRISIDMAELIIAELRSSGVKSVALFADKPIAMVNDYADRLEIDYVQLHGGESSDYAAKIKASVIRAVAVRPNQSANQILTYINAFPADYFVLDRHRQGEGDLVDDKLAGQIIAAKPGKVFLAGGLNPQNLAGVLARLHPYGIDIASGVRRGSSLDMVKVLSCLEILAGAGAN